MYFFSGAAALARGYNVLAFDGPGQGGALVQRGLTLRPDWEAVVEPGARRRGGPRRRRPGPHRAHRMEPRRASRAARGRGRAPARRVRRRLRRLRHVRGVPRTPRPAASSFEMGGARRRQGRARMLGAWSRPTGGWSLRRGMLVHGVDRSARVHRVHARLHAEGARRAHPLPDLVCSAEGDAISASAPQLVDAIRARTSTSSSPRRRAPATTASPAPACCTTRARSAGSTGFWSRAGPRDGVTAGQ